MKLTEWSIHVRNLCGTVEGSDRYEDGTYIETSEVVTAAFDGSLFLIRTQNSVYECSLDDYRGPEEVLTEFIRRLSEEEKRGMTKQVSGKK